MIAGGEAAAQLDGVTHRYGKLIALDAVTLTLPAGCMVGLIGPDGVGKSSLLAIIAGVRQIQSGKVDVLGGDMTQSAHRGAVCPRIAYMPQGLGKNLYPDLSIRENISSLAVYSDNRLLNGNGVLLSFLSVPGSRPSAIARPKNCRAV